MWLVTRSWKALGKYKYSLGKHRSTNSRTGGLLCKAGWSMLEGIGVEYTRLPIPKQPRNSATSVTLIEVAPYEQSSVVLL